MRYRHTGNVHKDFHLATNRSIQYVLSHYGDEFLRELFKRTAQQVYKDIHEHLQRGDASALLEHWKYYYDREDGVYEVSEDPDRIVFSVRDCPAYRHVRERLGAVPDEFYLQIRYLNEGFSEGTPFEITTDIVGDGAYTMVVRRTGS